MMKHLKSSICASLLCLRAALLPAADCTSLHLDYMSFTASGNWCGFNTYVATTPKIKYLVESVQQEAAECEASGMMDGYPLSIGLGKYLITPGTVTYSASCTETGAWSVTAWKQNGSSVGSLSASRSVIVTNLSNGYPFIDNYSGKPVSASVQYVPGSGGSRTITCTKDCQWSTNGGSLWSQVVLSTQNATTKVFTNSGNYTPATQTYALSEEYPRTELENTILTRLAACGDPGWGKSTTYSASGCTTASPASKTAASTLSGDTLTLRKIKYRFTFKSEKDAVYNLTWDEVFSFADGSPPQRMPRAETVIGNGSRGRS